MYSEYFIHPYDAKALNALKSVPGFAILAKKFMEIFAERTMKITNLSSKLRLSETQLPELYNLLPPICEKLEIPVPELYLEQDPRLNAYTYGETTPCIVLTSGIVNNCPVDVIRAVLAHECGHIVCKHVLYKMMARFFLGVGASIVNIPIFTFTLKYALLYWDRCSEYSADRASAYACGGSESVVKTMAALSSGSSELLTKVNPDEFLKQAEEFHMYSEESAWNKFLMYWQLSETDHPFTADRAADIVKWCDSQDYKNLCDGIPFGPQNVNAPQDPNSAPLRQCPNCNGFTEVNSVFCPRCGTKLI